MLWWFGRVDEIQHLETRAERISIADKLQSQRIGWKRSVKNGTGSVLAQSMFASVVRRVASLKKDTGGWSRLGLRCLTIEVTQGSEEDFEMLLNFFLQLKGV